MSAAALPTPSGGGTWLTRRDGRLRVLAVLAFAVTVVSLGQLPTLLFARALALVLLVGLRRPSAGSVVVLGAECRSEADFLPVRRRVGLLFQDSDDQLFCPTVPEDIAFGPLNLGLGPPQARALAEETLAALGLVALAGHVTHKLSAARSDSSHLPPCWPCAPRSCCSMSPPTASTRTPSSNSSTTSSAHLVGLEQTLLFVTHDCGLVVRLATRVALQKGGRLHPATLHVHPHTHVHAHIHPQVGAAQHAQHDDPSVLRGAAERSEEIPLGAVVAHHRD